MEKGEDAQNLLADLEEVERQLGFISNQVGDHGMSIKRREELKSDEADLNHSRSQFQSLEAQFDTKQEKDPGENRQPTHPPIEDSGRLAFDGFSAFLSIHGPLLEGSFSSENVGITQNDEIEGMVERDGDRGELDQAFATYLLPDQPECVSGRDENFHGHEVDLKGDVEKEERYDDSGYASISFDSSSDHSPDFNYPSSSSLSLMKATSSSSSVEFSRPETKANVAPEPLVRPKPRSSEFFRQVLRREHNRVLCNTQQHRRTVTNSQLSNLAYSSRAEDDNHVEDERARDDVEKASTPLPDAFQSVSIINPPDLRLKPLTTTTDSSYLAKPWFYFGQPPPSRSGPTRKILPLPVRAPPGPWLNPRPFRRNIRGGGSYGSWLRSSQMKGDKGHGKEPEENESSWGVKTRKSKGDDQKQALSLSSASEPNLKKKISTNLDMDVGMEVGTDLEVKVEMLKADIEYGGDPVMFATLNILGERFPWGWEC